MDFNISSADLLKGILDVSKALPAKAPQQIFENFLFELKGESLRITASDGDLTLRTSVHVDSTREEGDIAVPARQFIELFKALPDQPVTVRTTSDSNFECIWSNGNSSLPYFPAADFPEIKGADETAEQVVFPAQALVEGISSTIYATADDEMRPMMNGIFFDIAEKSTTFVASDSHKLICYTTTEAGAPQPCSFILHKKPAAVLRSLLDKSEGEVQIRFDSSSVEFHFDDALMICRLVKGKYPKYRDVIPQNNANILKIDRAQLLNTVKRVAVCANRASNHIKLNLKSGQLEITAQDLGFSIAAYEKLGCDYSGDELSIGFKSNFLADILGNMSCNTVVIKFADARRAALIVPAEEEAESEKLCGIIMPIMVS
ncbi:MAG: DNA polymerase III subunit beta [Bacteroidales bacterium]|nr:DNA polymerase III subunit beta [Bacteroidales bacterium]